MNGLDDVVRLRGQSAEERMRGRETYIFERLWAGQLSLPISQRIIALNWIAWGKVVQDSQLKFIFFMKKIFYLTQPGTTY